MNSPRIPPVMGPQNASALMEELQAATKVALDKAVMFPSVEHFKAYKLLQDFWAEKASQFTQASKEALL